MFVLKIESNILKNRTVSSQFQASFLWRLNRPLPFIKLLSVRSSKRIAGPIVRVYFMSAHRATCEKNIYKKTGWCTS